MPVVGICWKHMLETAGNKLSYVGAVGSICWKPRGTSCWHMLETAGNKLSTVPTEEPGVEVEGKKSGGKLFLFLVGTSSCSAANLETRAGRRVTWDSVRAGRRVTWDTSGESCSDLSDQL